MFIAPRNASAQVVDLSGLAIAALGIGALAFIARSTHLPEIAGVRFEILAPILLLAILGLIVSNRTSLARCDGASRKAVVLAALVSGVGFGIVTFALDVGVGSASLLAMRDLGGLTVTASPLAKLYDCAAVTVLTEALYRFIPLSFAYWLIAHHILGGRWESYAFWGIGAASSVIEPVSYAISAGAAPDLPWLLGSLLAFSLSETTLWRYYGWIAPLLARFSYYAVSQAVLVPMMSAMS
jgi:hypothetical protein